MNRFPLQVVAVILVFGLFAAACAPSQVTQTAGPPTQANPTQASPTVTNPPSVAATSQMPVTGATSGASGGIKFSLVEGKSEASYRVREQLANRDLPSDAVGTTQSISGTVEVKPDGSINQAESKFTVDLTTLTTDAQMRDNFVRRNVLQTDQYPQAVFVAKQAVGLQNPLPTSGQVSFKLIGDMTIHGVTKELTWDVTGTLDGSEATGVATTSFKFEDFGLNQPRVPVVLSVVDNITLEVKGDLLRATN